MKVSESSLNVLVMSNFSFSHSVFKRLVSEGRQKVSLCGNGLNRLNIEVEWALDLQDLPMTKNFKPCHCRLSARGPGLILFAEGFNPLPDDRILDWSVLKQIADDTLKFI